MNGLKNGLQEGLISGLNNGLAEGLANGLTNGLFVNEYPFDIDANKFLLAANINDIRIKNAINKLVINLKAANIWTKMKAVYPFVGGTATAHKFNLKNSADTDAAFRLNFVGGWTHSSNGVLPNGTNGYANTFLIPNTNLTLNNSHFSVYSRTNTSGNLVDLGIQDDMGPGIGVLGGTFYVFTRDASNNLVSTISTSDANTVIVSNSDSRGFFATSRTANNSLKQYKNSTLLSTQTALASGYQARYAVTLGALYYVNDIAPQGYFYYSNRQCAFASIGDGLTDAEALSFYNAVNAFQVSLARNV